MPDQTPLDQVAADLVLVERQLRAAAVIVGAALVALGDAMQAEAKRMRGARKASLRQAQQGA